MRLSSGCVTYTTKRSVRRGAVSLDGSSGRAERLVSVQPQRIRSSIVDLPLTGERTLPGIAAENYWFRRHEVAYTYASAFCRGALVVDAGAGEGYGAAMLAGIARQVIGVDYDSAAVTHAGAAYRTVSVARASLVHLPFADGSVDAVVALQVIEHLWDQPGFLRECRRILRPAGTLLLSTPNRLTFPAGNLFHSREFSPGELRAVLARDFRVSRLFGLHHGRRLQRLDRRHGGSIVTAQLSAPTAVWHPRLRLDVASVRVADFSVSPRRLQSSLDLLAVATRR